MIYYYLENMNIISYITIIICLQYSYYIILLLLLFTSTTKQQFNFICAYMYVRQCSILVWRMVMYLQSRLNADHKLQ
jgi:hypothetical protein